MAERGSDQEYLNFVTQQIKWNKRTADRTMVQFIAVRLGLVLVSAALPALTTLHHQVWAIAASVTVTALTGLDTQFQWGDEWRHFRTTQLALERARRDYDRRVHEALDVAPSERTRAERENFTTFYKEVEYMLQKDTDRFFKFRITPFKRRPAE